MTVPPHGQADPSPTPGPVPQPAPSPAAVPGSTPTRAEESTSAQAAAPAPAQGAGSAPTRASEPVPTEAPAPTRASEPAPTPASGASPVLPTTAAPAVIPPAPAGNATMPIFLAPYRSVAPTQESVQRLQKTAAATKPAPRGVRKWWLWAGSLLSALALFGATWVADVATRDVPPTDTSQLVLGTDELVALDVPNSAECEVESPSTSAYEGATYKCTSDGSQYHLTSMVMVGNNDLSTVLERGVRYLVGLRDQPNLQPITGGSSDWNAAAYSAEFTGGDEDYGYMVALQPTQDNDIAIVAVILAQDEKTGETVFGNVLDSAGLTLQSGASRGRGGQPLDGSGEGRTQDDGGILASWPSGETDGQPATAPGAVPASTDGTAGAPGAVPANADGTAGAPGTVHHTIGAAEVVIRNVGTEETTRGEGAEGTSRGGSTEEGISA